MKRIFLTTRDNTTSIFGILCWNPGLFALGGAYSSCRELITLGCFAQNYGGSEVFALSYFYSNEDWR